MPAFSFEGAHQKSKSRKVSEELKISIQNSNFSPEITKENLVK